MPTQAQLDKYNALSPENQAKWDAGVAKKMATDAARTTSTGTSGLGSYSFAPAKYESQTLTIGKDGSQTVTGGGLITDAGVHYVGAAGGDTQAARDSFETNVVNTSPLFQQDHNFNYVGTPGYKTPETKTTGMMSDPKNPAPTPSTDNGKFFNAVMEKYEAGGLTDDQIQKVSDQYNSGRLTTEQNNQVYNSFIKPTSQEGGTYAAAGRAGSGNWEATDHGGEYDARYSLDYGTTRLNDTHGLGDNNQKINELSQWLTDTRVASRRDPEAFNAWVQDNPEEAIRFYALQAQERWNGGAADKKVAKENQQIADSLAMFHAKSLGYGDDGKMDGKMIASNFDTFNDLTNEGGPGDIWKLGNASSLPGGLNDFIEDNPWAVVGTVAASVLAGPAAGALVNAGYTAGQAAIIVSAGGSAIQTAMAGGDVGDILKAGAVGAVGGGVLDKVMPAAYSADNVAGSFVKGATNEGISSLIQGDGLDAKGMLVAGATKTGFDTLKDLGSDAIQTNDGNLIEGVDTVNGAAMTAADVERLTNTSDLHGVLGENGLLSKAGIELGYMPTDFIGNVADFLGLGGRPVVDPGGKIGKKAQAELEGIGSDESLTFEERNEQIKNVVNQYYTDTAPYDERFFDITTERSSDATQTGIYEKSPYSSDNTSFTFSTEGGQGSLPGATSDPSLGTFEVGGDTTLQGTGTGTTPGMMTETGTLPGTTGGDTGDLNTGTGGMLAGTDTIPTGSNGTDTIPTGGDTDYIPAGGGDTEFIPDGDPGGDPDPEPWWPEPETIPGGGGGGGGGGGAGLTAALQAGMLTPTEFQPFMATIETNFPVLSKLNLQPKDYLKMLIGRMNA